MRKTLHRRVAAPSCSALAGRISLSRVRARACSRASLRGPTEAQGQRRAAGAWHSRTDSIRTGAAAVVRTRTAGFGHCSGRPRQAVSAKPPTAGHRCSPLSRAAQRASNPGQPQPGDISLRRRFLVDSRPPGWPSNGRPTRGLACKAPPALLVARRRDGSPAMVSVLIIRRLGMNRAGRAAFEAGLTASHRVRFAVALFSAIG